MSKKKIMDGVQKYTMILILVLVVAFFTWRTDGKLLLPQNITNIIAQNAYVFVLATGMLLCILTGGNIDLSVGSVVCFVGALGAVWLAKGMNMWLVGGSKPPPYNNTNQNHTHTRDAIPLSS